MITLVSEEDLDLFISARLNDVEAMAHLLRTTAYSTFSLNESLVLVSLRRRRFDAFQVLLDAGADLDYRGYRGKTCLEFAEQNRAEPLIELIMGKSGQASQRRERQSSLDRILIQAAKTGMEEDLLNALQDGAYPDSLDQHRHTPLMNASYRGYLAICRHLLIHGASATYSINGWDAISLTTHRYARRYLKKGARETLGRMWLYFHRFRIRRLLRRHVRRLGLSVPEDHGSREDSRGASEDREELDALLASICQVSAKQWQERKVLRGITMDG